MSVPVRVGVVGAGAIVQVAHLPVLSKLNAVQVVGICDLDVPKAQAIASRLDVPEVYDDIEDLIQYAKPDAVVICTPNHLHDVHVKTALAAGVHVLCERPIALSVNGVRKVAEAGSQAGRAVMVGMNHRYRGDVQAVREFLKSGELGPLRSIRAGWYTVRPSGHALGWRDRRREAGGGAMLDRGLALLDLALWLAGPARPLAVSAELDAPDDRSVEDSGCAFIRCEGGLTIFVDVSWHHVAGQERFWFELACARGTASVAPLKVFKELHGTPMSVTPAGSAGRENAFMASYRSEWVYFLAMVRGDVQPPDLKDQILLHQTMDAIAKSAKEGRDITL